MVNKRWKTVLFSYLVLLGLLQVAFLPAIGFDQVILANGEFLYSLVGTPIIATPSLLLESLGTDLWTIIGFEIYVSIQRILYAVAYFGLAGAVYIRTSERSLRATQALFSLNLVLFLLAEFFPSVPFDPLRALLYMAIMGLGIYVTEVSAESGLLNRLTNIGSSAASSTSGSAATSLPESEVPTSPAAKQSDSASGGGTSRAATPDVSDEEIGPQSGTRQDLEAAAEQQVPRPIPTEIPRVSNVDVDYGKLTDEERIGGGGNADVSKATVQTPSGAQTVAIKTPRFIGTLDKHTADRILAEAETWDRLDDHDHIVGVIDYDSDPLPWIAMEYMDAGHLGERLADESLSFAERRWIAIAITRAVRQAHRRGVAHLDLKPENVLFRSVDDAWDVPKVADWGLSKHLLDHSKSVDGLSPGYAAPEQFDDDCGPSDDRTDIYGLGAVIYELFTGRPPFEGSPMEVMRSIVTETPDPPSEVADVPQAVDEALAPALATDRDDRYEDVLRLRDALEALPERD